MASEYLALRFGGNGVSDRMHQAGIPGCGETNSLGKDGRIAGSCYAMKAFVPPGVFGDPQPRDGRRGHGHLGDFFLGRQAADEVRDTLLDGERRVLKRIIGRIGEASEEPQKHRGQPRIVGRDFASKASRVNVRIVPAGG